MTRISSPCTKICKIDEAGGRCPGCGRTLAQIASWGAMSEKERQAIMAGLDGLDVDAPNLRNHSTGQ